MTAPVERAIAEALGAEPTSLSRLTGGSVGEVYRASLPNGEDVVVKVDASNEPALDIEGYMLEYLASRTKLPVPKVFHSSPPLLIMEMLPGESQFSANAQAHAAELLADLHGITSDRYGLEADTLIGSLHQPNTMESSWIDFFIEHRLLHMARRSHELGRFGKKLLRRIEALAERLSLLLEEPEQPSLLHGDIWSTNVLASGDRITGFIDPAIYYGHPEIELAFIALFGTFDIPFFDRYNELREIRPGFFEERSDLYNLYPLLVHVRLFGGSYVGSVEAILARYGY